MEQEHVAQAGNLLAGQGARDVRRGLEGAVASGWLDAADGAALTEAHGLCWKVHMVARLLGSGVLDPGRIGEAGAAFLLRETGEQSLGSLERRLAGVCAAAAGAIDRALAGKEG